MNSLPSQILNVGSNSKVTLYIKLTSELEMNSFIRHTCFVMALLLTSTCSLCQIATLDKNIMIGGFQTSIFYSDNRNLLGVSSAKDSVQNLIIKSSQGNLENVDSGIVNGFLSLTNLKNGKVTISVFRKANTGLLLLNYKTFAVVTKPLTPDEIKIKKLTITPEITLAGYKSGKVPLHDIKNVDKFLINKPYRIKNMTVYVGSYTGICSQPIAANLTSANFDDNFKNIWKRLGIATYIQLEFIDIIDEKGIIYRMNPIAFRTDRE